MIELFGERVLALLTERGMTQRELAEAIDVTEVTISRYMTRRREPKATTVMKIAEFFGVTTDYLLRGIQCSDCTRRKFYMDGYEAGRRDGQRWIPCSERKPKERFTISAPYIVTVKEPDTEPYSVPAIYYFERKVFVPWYTPVGEYEITAWMPLPDPYREE